jgi:hypothetical protein
LHSGDIGIAIGRAARALAVPQHLAQAFHGGVVRVVQGIQALDSNSTAWRMPRGWSMLHCSLMDRCIDRCKKGLVRSGVSS